MYFVRQAWANSIDPDETPQTQRLIRVYTVCTRPAILDTIVGSKLDLFKFLIKYGKEMRCLNTKGNYGKVTNKYIFVEFIDQLIDYPINCASLNTSPSLKKSKAANTLSRSLFPRANF